MAQADAEIGGMNYFLGIDAGGTKTAAVIADAAGTERGRGTGGPCSLTTGDYPQWTRAIRDAARGACQSAGLPEDTRFAAVCAGVAGYSLKAKRVEFAEILAEEISADRYDLTPDYEIAYWGASGGEPGVVVIAGTGAVAYGRNLQGETHKADGLGFLLGDAGSGFALGRAALEITLENLQAKRSEPFSDAILAYLGAAAEEDILSWLYQDFSPGKAASLAPLVGQWAMRKNEAACELLRDAALAHRVNVHQIRSRLLLSGETLIYPLGGLWQIGAFFREQFACPAWKSTKEAEWSAAPLRYPITEPRYDAAMGAALSARHKVGK